MNKALSAYGGRIGSLKKRDRVILSVDSNSTIVSGINRPLCSFCKCRATNMFTASTTTRATKGSKGTLAGTVNMPFTTNSVRFMSRGGSKGVSGSSHIGLKDPLPSFCNDFFASIRCGKVRLSLAFNCDGNGGVCGTMEHSVRSVSSFSGRLASIGHH